MSCGCRALTVICYDVADDRRRQRIAEVLCEAHGRRVQKSVFELNEPPEKIRALQQRLHRLRGKEDSIVYYRLCKACQRDTSYDDAQSTSGKQG